MLNASSEKRLSQVHPELARRARAVIAELNSQGHNVQVVQGLRSFEEQDALYAQGRTKQGAIVTNAKAGYSNHNFGLAVDLCPFLSDGKPHWTAPESTWKAIGKAAERQGLEWGGRWKGLVDKPHVQLPGLSVSDCRALYKQGGLKLVWERATKARAAVEGQSIQMGQSEKIRPSAQTVTVTNPATPYVSTQITPLLQAPAATLSKPSTILLFRLLPFFSTGSIGAAFVAFVMHNKWQIVAVLIVAGLCALSYWLGWQHKRPHF